MSSDSKHAADYEKADFTLTRESTGADPHFESRTIRKVDWRLLPILGALYSFAQIDRTNLGIARVNGAGTELKLTVGNRYSIVNLIFWVPYILLELPSNLALRRVGAAIWLGSIGLLWGAVMIGMGFVQTWQQLTACRAMLGMLEAGFFPACVYVISCWYTRRELQTRLASFYFLSVFVGAFANILAYGLAQIKVGSMPGWRWIFIVEGMITCTLGLLGYFVICDFPDKNSFLSPSETQLVKNRIDRDRGDAVYDQLTWTKARRYAVDVKLWGFALMFMCTTMPLYAYANFFPIILRGMGFSVRDSQLLLAPPGVVAAVVALVIARLADKLNRRGIFIVLQSCIAIIGLCMTAFAKRSGVRFAGGFFISAGAQGNIVAILSYQSNNIRGQSKRAFSSALVVGFGGIGGIFASTAYRERDSPNYLIGLWSTIGCQIVIITVVGITTMWFMYRNRQVKGGSGRPIEGLEGFSYTL